VKIYTAIDGRFAGPCNEALRATLGLAIPDVPYVEEQHFAAPRVVFYNGEWHVENGGIPTDEAIRRSEDALDALLLAEKARFGAGPGFCVLNVESVAVSFARACAWVQSMWCRYEHATLHRAPAFDGTYAESYSVSAGSLFEYWIEVACRHFGAVGFYGTTGYPHPEIDRHEAEMIDKVDILFPSCYPQKSGDAASATARALKRAPFPTKRTIAVVCPRYVNDAQWSPMSSVDWKGTLRMLASSGVTEMLLWDAIHKEEDARFYTDAAGTIPGLIRFAAAASGTRFETSVAAESADRGA
jgi:hypothetical protein